MSVAEPVLCWYVIVGKKFAEKSPFSGNDDCHTIPTPTTPTSASLIGGGADRSPDSKLEQYINEITDTN